jgi:hypothetical protein
MEPDRHDERDGKRDAESGQRGAEHAPAQLIEVDLEPRQQQQEPDADQRQHLHGGVDLRVGPAATATVTRGS